jgi:alpha/beta superfamily hydrolase
LNTREFDAAFDERRDVSEAVDWSRARRPNLAARSVKFDCPA